MRKLYDIVKDNDKTLNYLNFFIQIDVIMYVNTPLKDIDKSLNLFVLKHTKIFVYIL